jgi:colanic acid/amylovoran biosynthesis glycosyltransferase
MVAPSVTAANGDMEGIPVAMMEAMASGLPVVSTIHSGIPELIEDDATGYLVPEGDVGALAARLSRLARDFSASQRVCAAARRLIVQRHDIDKLNDRLVRHFNALTDDGIRALGRVHLDERRARGEASGASRETARAISVDASGVHLNG